MKLDPRHLEIVAAVVSTGGLTEAAQLLGRSQPSLSRTLSDLEKRLGSPLFEPGRRPLRPTEFGRLLADAGQRVLDARMDATEMVSRYRNGHVGNLRIGGSPFFLDGVVAPMLADFQRQTPQVRIAQSYGYLDDLSARLLAGTLDLAICPVGAGFDLAGLEFEPILPGTNVIACRAGHPLTRARGITPLQIGTFPWIAPPPDSPLHADLLNAVASIGAEAEVTYSGGSLSAVLSILAGTDALTILPYSVVFLRRREGIEALSLKIAHPDRTLGLLYRQGREALPSVVRARQFIKSRFGSLAQSIQHHQKNQVWRGM